MAGRSSSSIYDGKAFLIVCPIEWDKKTERERDRSLSIWLQKINGKAFLLILFYQDDE